MSPNMWRIACLLFQLALFQEITVDGAYVPSLTTDTPMEIKNVSAPVRNPRYLPRSSDSSEEFCTHGKCDRKYRQKSTRAPTVFSNCKATCPKCPSIDSSIFNSDESYVIPLRFGKLVSSSACDKTYMLSYKKMNWFDAYRQCCKLGMKLISFETQKKIICFANLFTGEMEYYRLWTSATNKDCDKEKASVWSWCSSRKEVSISWWGNGEPDPDRFENCAAVNIGVIPNGQNTYYMSDNRCNTEFYFVCEQ